MWQVISFTLMLLVPSSAYSITLGLDDILTTTDGPVVVRFDLNGNVTGTVVFPSDDFAFDSIAIERKDTLLLGDIDAARVWRADLDGTILGSFFLPVTNVFSKPVLGLAVEPGGTILAAALGVPDILRLRPSGALVNTIPSPFEGVTSLAVEEGGTILAGGEAGIFRLNPDGSIVSTLPNPFLNLGVAGEVRGLGVTTDGTIIAGYVARLFELNASGGVLSSYGSLPTNITGLAVFVPEPSTATLVGCGLLALVGVGRRLATPRSCP